METDASYLPPARRTFAQLHRDAWRLLARFPLVFVVLPVLLWLPLDYLTEIVTRAISSDGMDEFRVSMRISQLTMLLFGTLLFSIQFSFLRMVAENEAPSTRRALLLGADRWRNVLQTYWSSIWRITLGLFLLLIPGLILAYRYFLAVPVTVFEGETGKPALDRSQELLRGRLWRIVFISLGWGAIYAPVLLSLGFLTPAGAGPVLSTLTAAPFNLIFSLQALLQAMIYQDLREGVPAPPPLGRDARTDPWVPAVSQLKSRFGVLLAVVLSWAFCIAAFIVSFFLMTAPIDKGDEQYVMGNYETALQHYERAIYWDDQDAYVYYSIGLCHYMLDDLAEAEEAAAEAVRLEPADHDYRVFWIGVLLGLQRTGQARNEAEMLFQLGFEYEGGIETLLYDLQENFYSEPEALQGS